MHILIQDVRSAFWRTAGAQKLNAQVKAAILGAEGALADSRKAEAKGSALTAGRPQIPASVTRKPQVLEGVEQELASARIELANMLNIPLVVDLKAGRAGRIDCYQRP